jgi:hypothetical protein
MTQIDNSNNLPNLTPVQRAHKDLNQATLKFQNALAVYDTATGDDKVRLKSMMDDQLKLIQASIQEIKKAGMAKQGQKVSTDYQNYLKANTTEHFDALEHDIQTLRDYNQIP